MNKSLLFIFAAAVAMLAGCGGPAQRAGGDIRFSDDKSLSCSDIARRKAERQYAADTTLLDDQAGGFLQDSGWRRDMAAHDAEAYRRSVYRECRRLRGASTPTPGATE